MIPVLAAFLMAQIIYNKSIDKDESFLFFLWVGVFAVFSASFSYLIYSISVLIYFFLQQSSGSDFSLKSLLKIINEQKYQLLFTAILAVILFIFFPRFYNFLPSANNKAKGEIGYSKNVNNSSMSQLNLSSKTAFYAEIDRIIPQEILYWRGSVNTYTDGYNWKTADIPPYRSDLLKRTRPNN